eukprot:m.709716 g.709716  ORF g.709716 m.709716 type:complete len:559 (+) comp22945_c0_seq20:974-2650(+)
MEESIASVVVLREPNAKRAIVVLRFITSMEANAFLEMYDGQFFDEENASAYCHVARVAHVYTVGITAPPQATGGEAVILDHAWRLMPWARGLVELPRCPVCCERIDSTFKPVLYTRNQRHFPSRTDRGTDDDISMTPAWRDMSDRCSVCRVLQRRVPTPVGMSPAESATSSPLRPLAQLSSVATTVPSGGDTPGVGAVDSTPVAESVVLRPPQSNALHCKTCGETSEKLWVCLLCGFVGCPRPQYGVPGSTPASAAAADSSPINRGHMLQHWHHTGYHHNLSVALDTLFIWDYVQDAFVHRSSGDFDTGSTVANVTCDGIVNAGFPVKFPGGAHGAEGYTPNTTGAHGTSFLTPDECKAEHHAHYGDAAGKTGSDWGTEAWSQSPIQAAAAADTGVMIRDWKIEQITTEYVALLSAQLESQRAFFADQALQCRQRADSEIAQQHVEIKAAEASVDALMLELDKQTKVFEAKKADLGSSEASLAAMLGKVRTERARIVGTPACLIRGCGCCCCCCRYGTATMQVWCGGPIASPLDVPCSPRLGGSTFIAYASRGRRHAR